MKNPQLVHEQIIQAIRDFFAKNNFEKAVIGLSGGIDSSLTLKLAVDALGGSNITGLLMPENGITRDENMYHARGMAEFLGVKTHSIPINRFIMEFGILPWKGSAFAQMNVKARMRMAILYHYANTHQALVLGTSNKSEILLGYGTKFGDFAADLEVLGQLYKDDVYDLARYLELPDEIIKKEPTAELTRGQTDEMELGASYRELDPILRKRDLGAQALLEKGINPGLIHKTLHRIEENQHKTLPTPIIHIPALEDQI